MSRQGAGRWAGRRRGAQGAERAARVSAQGRERHGACRGARVLGAGRAGMRRHAALCLRHDQLRLATRRWAGHNTTTHALPGHGLCAQAWAKLVHCAPGSVLTQFLTQFLDSVLFLSHFLDTVHEPGS